MKRARRPSLQTLDVLAAMLTDPTAECRGTQLTEQAKLSPGSVYAILAALEQAGWISGRREQGTPKELGRRPRHLSP